MHVIKIVKLAPIVNRVSAYIIKLLRVEQKKNPLHFWLIFDIKGAREVVKISNFFPNSCNKKLLQS